MKIANIDRESLHIFWANWGISLKFSGKMWLMIILKLTKNHGSTVSLEDALSGKPQGEGGGEWVAGSNRPWTFPVLLGLTNENVKEKERKKFLIFVMFTLAWLLCQYNRCFVLLLDSSICLGLNRFKNQTWTAKRAPLFEK